MKISDTSSFLRKNALRILLFGLPLLSVAMHWRVFKTDLVGVHVWRQAQTQSVIVNFYEEDFNILNPRQNDRGSGDGIRRMEFPLMQWLFAGFYKIFGNHLVISRILSFVIGICSVAGMFFLLKNLFKDLLAAFAGAWALNFSPSFFYHTMNPLPDNFALCCAIWGLAFFFHWHEKRTSPGLFFCGLFLCLATLSKLPFVICFVVPFSYFFFENRQENDFGNFAKRALTVAAFLLPAAAWYVWVIPEWHGTGVVSGIFGNETPIGTLLRYVWDNLISVLPEMLLNYASLPFFLAGFYFLVKQKSYRDKRFAPLALLGMAAVAYFLFEINMIANVHDYYLFPFVPMLFVLVGYGAGSWLQNEKPGWQRAAVVLLLLMPVAAYLRHIKSWNPASPGFNKDWLVYKKELYAAAPDDVLCVVGNDVSYQIFFYHIDKKGWPFTENRVTASSLKGMISEGAKYLYSDTRQIDENAEIQPLLDSLVLEKGSVRVFRLRQ